MTFARRKAGWGSLRLFFLNPPHPSLTEGRASEGLLPSGLLQTGGTLDGMRRSYPLSPSGIRFTLACGTLFPLRVRLTFGSPGLPGGDGGDTTAFGAPGVWRVRSRLLSPSGPAFTAVLLPSKERGWRAGSCWRATRRCPCGMR